MAELVGSWENWHIPGGWQLIAGAVPLLLTPAIIEFRCGSYDKYL
jgi:hypothetical protein